MVFQDPYGSLDPRKPVGWIVAEPLHGVRRRRAHARASAQALDAVGLRAGPTRDKYPHEFSGGQRQRIAIARALITRPRADRRRRAGQRARRVGAGAGAQPDGRPAARSSASPTCSSATTWRWCDHVCDEVAVLQRGPHRRARRRRGAVQPAAASVHARAARRRAARRRVDAMLAALSPRRRRCSDRGRTPRRPTLRSSLAALALAVHGRARPRPARTAPCIGMVLEPPPGLDPTTRAGRGDRRDRPLQRARRA